MPIFKVMPLRHCSLAALALCLMAATVGGATVEAESLPAPTSVLLNGRPAHPTRILVKAKAPLKAGDQARVAAAQGLVEIRASSLVPGLSVLDVGAVQGAALAVQFSLSERIDRLRASGLFELVEPDHVVTIDRTPMDTNFVNGTLWGLRNLGINGGVAGVDIGAPAAWDLSTGSTNLIIAIIDTGIRYTHQDLSNQMWINPGEIAGNGLDDDHDGFIDDVYGINVRTKTGNPMDDNGHGTHVAGTIGAAANDGHPMVGVLWSVKLMACKFLDSGGAGYISESIPCIEYAVAHGARIINASGGSTDYDEALFQVIQAAGAKGVLFVAAAGNSSFNCDDIPFYPACFPASNVLSVASIGAAGNLSSWSNYGRNSVHLAAPGESIFSCSGAADDAYEVKSGTSMASPHVVGVAGLVWAMNPSLSMSDVRQRLFDTVVKMPVLSSTTITGGRVNAYGALMWPPDACPTLRVQPQSLVVRLGDPATFNVTASGAAPFTYQWQFSDTNLPGLDSTNASYTIPAVSSANFGNYTVVVANSWGSVTSAVAVLSLGLPPSLLTQPQGQTVLAGHSASLSITVAGTSPFYYQWFQNGAPLGAANLPTQFYLNYLA